MYPSDGFSVSSPAALGHVRGGVGRGRTCWPRPTPVAHPCNKGLENLGSEPTSGPGATLLLLVLSRARWVQELASKNQELLLQKITQSVLRDFKR